MIPYSVYKVVHLAGILMTFLAVGARLVKPEARVVATYITGLVMALVGGFGLLARIGVSHGEMPIWAMLKLCIWIVFANILFVVGRRPEWSKYIWPFAILLGATAAYLAGTKPI